MKKEKKGAMQNSEIRVVMKYEFNRGSCALAAARNINSACSNRIFLSLQTVRRWFNKFATGDFDLSKPPVDGPEIWNVNFDELKNRLKSDKKKHHKSNGKKHRKSAPDDVYVNLNKKGNGGSGKDPAPAQSPPRRPEEAVLASSVHKTVNSGSGKGPAPAQDQAQPKRPEDAMPTAWVNKTVNDGSDTGPAQDQAQPKRPERAMPASSVHKTVNNGSGKGPAPAQPPPRRPQGAVPPPWVNMMVNDGSHKGPAQDQAHPKRPEGAMPTAWVIETVNDGSGPAPAPAQAPLRRLEGVMPTAWVIKTVNGGSGRGPTSAQAQMDANNNNNPRRRPEGPVTAAIAEMAEMMKFAHKVNNETLGNSRMIVQGEMGTVTVPHSVVAMRNSTFENNDQQFGTFERPQETNGSNDKIEKEVNNRNNN